MLVYLCVAGGLIAGYTAPWPVALGVCGAVAVLAAADFVPPACVLYFGAACMIAGSGVKSGTRPHGPRRADPSALGERLRLRAALAIDSTFAQDAPIARALLIADQSEIPREVKLMYADAGIVHMLAISGLHVSIVAASLALMLGVVRVPVRTASFVTAGAISMYVFILGFPAPALRAAVMILVTTAGHACQRHSSRWSVLALGGLIPLVRPSTVTEVGYQLSMAGMAGVIAAGVLVRRGSFAQLGGLRRRLAQSLAVSVTATAVTGPLVAAYFGRLSLVGPITNLAADPVIAVVQPMLFLALILAPFPAGARHVAVAAHPLLQMFEAIARTASSLPLAAVPVAMSVSGFVLALLCAGAVIATCISRFPARSALVALGAGSLAVWLA